jgi:hypothetical protein
MNAANLLECAAGLMDLRGHCNDGPGATRKEVCALEAIAMAAGIGRGYLYYSTPESPQALYARARGLGGGSKRHGDNCCTVYAYNDRRGRTKAEMIAAMRGAAAVLRAQQAAQAVRYQVEAVCI